MRLSLLAIGLLALVVAGDQTAATLLKPNYRPGQKFAVSRSLELAGHTVSADGYNTMKYEYKGALTEEGTEEIVAADGGRPTAFKRTFTKGLMEVLETNTEKYDRKDLSADYAGKTATFGADGKVTGEGIDPKAIERTSINDSLLPLLPDGEVKADEPWKVKGDALNPLIRHFAHTEDTVEAKATCTLKEVKEEGGKKLAVIAVKLKYNVNRKWTKLTRGAGGTLEGMLTFNMTDGYIASAELADNEGSSGGTWDYGSGVAKLTGKATAKISYKAQLQ